MTIFLQEKHHSASEDTVSSINVKFEQSADIDDLENDTTEDEHEVVSEKVEQFLGMNLHPGLKIFGDMSNIDVGMVEDSKEQLEDRTDNVEDMKELTGKYETFQKETPPRKKCPISKAMKKELEREIGHPIYRGLRITIVQ